MCAASRFGLIGGAMNIILMIVICINILGVIIEIIFIIRIIKLHGVSVGV